MEGNFGELRSCAGGVTEPRNLDLHDQGSGGAEGPDRTGLFIAVRPCIFAHLLTPVRIKKNDVVDS